MPDDFASARRFDAAQGRAYIPSAVVITIQVNRYGLVQVRHVVLSKTNTLSTIGPEQCYHSDMFIAGVLLSHPAALVFRQRQDRHTLSVRACRLSHPSPTRCAEDKGALSQPHVAQYGIHRGSLVTRATQIQQERGEVCRKWILRRRRVRGVAHSATEIELLHTPDLEVTRRKAHRICSITKGCSQFPACTSQ